MTRITTKGKYPPGVEWNEYTKVVGAYGVEAIASVLRKLGYSADTSPVSANNVDIWVKKDRKLVLVIESLNWRRTSYSGDERVEQIRKNLRSWNVARLLIASFYHEAFSVLENDGITVLETGMNILPEDYYQFYKSRGEAAKFGMTTFNSSVEQTLTRKISHYLETHSI